MTKTYYNHNYLHNYCENKSIQLIRNYDELKVTRDTKIDGFCC